MIDFVIGILDLNLTQVYKLRN